MDDDRQPAEALEAAISEVLEPWLVRCVLDTVHHEQGTVPGDLVEQARDMAVEAAAVVRAEVHGLLSTDVDAQADTPLSVLRRAVRFPTEVLRTAGIAPVPRDAVEQRAFPDDLYGLAPRTWADVGPGVHDAAIVWGAWKAAVVLHRRRAEGRR